MARSAHANLKETRASVEDAATKFKGKAYDAASRAQHNLEEAGERACEYSREAAHQAGRTVKKYPLGTIAGAAVLGVLIGASLRR